MNTDFIKGVIVPIITVIDEEEKINEAGKEIGEAHDIQTAMMSAECDGQAVEKSILLIHAQDHFMTALAVRDMAQLMVEMYEKLGPKKD